MTFPAQRNAFLGDDLPSEDVRFTVSSLTVLHSSQALGSNLIDKNYSVLAFPNNIGTLPPSTPNTFQPTTP
jgi:hypothetical protein